MDLRRFLARYPDDATCRAHVEALRWPNGPICPRCGSVNLATQSGHDPRIWRCRACRHEFRVTDGTPMEGSHLPLNTWFLAIYLIATSSKGISAMKLKDMLGLSYKTAWFLGHRVRAMLADGSAEKLTGVVEADETYVGGRKRKKRDDAEDQDGRPPHRGRGRARSTVLVATQRKGRVKAKRIASHGVEDIAPKLWAWVSPNETVLATDELPAYRWIGRKFAAHLRVRHVAGEYARTDARTGIRAHVNTAESFNSQFKRAIIGVWHLISAKHCDRYLAEVAFRWNARGLDAEGRLDAMVLTGQRLRFRELISA